MNGSISEEEKSNFFKFVVFPKFLNPIDVQIASDYLKTIPTALMPQFCHIFADNLIIPKENPEITISLFVHSISSVEFLVCNSHQFPNSLLIRFDQLCFKLLKPDSNFLSHLNQNIRSWSIQYPDQLKFDTCRSLERIVFKPNNNWDLHKSTNPKSSIYYYLLHMLFSRAYYNKNFSLKLMKRLLVAGSIRFDDPIWDCQFFLTALCSFSKISHSDLVAILSETLFPLSLENFVKSVQDQPSFEFKITTLRDLLFQFCTASFFEYILCISSQPMNLNLLCSQIHQAFFTLPSSPINPSSEIDPASKTHDQTEHENGKKTKIRETNYFDFLQKLTLAQRERPFFGSLIDQFLDVFLQDHFDEEAKWATFSEISANLLQAASDSNESYLDLRSRFLGRINVFLFETTQDIEILDMVPLDFFLDHLLSEEHSINELLMNDHSAARIKKIFLSFIKSMAVSSIRNLEALLHHHESMARDHSRSQSSQTFTLSAIPADKLLEKFWSLILLPSFHTIRNETDQSLWISTYFEPLMTLLSPVSTRAFFDERNCSSERSRKLKIFSQHFHSILQLILKSSQYCHGPGEGSQIWPVLKDLFLQNVIQNITISHLFQRGFLQIIEKHTELQTLKYLENLFIGNLKPSLYHNLITAIVEYYFRSEMSKADRETTFNLVTKFLKNHLGMNSESGPFSFLSLSFLQQGFDLINNFLENHPFRFPTSLSDLADYICQCGNEFSPEDSFVLQGQLEKLKTLFQKIHQKFIDQDFSFDELQDMSTRPNSIQNFNSLLAQLKLSTEGIDIHMLNRMKKSITSAETELRNVFNFLKEKNLCYSIGKDGSLKDIYQSSLATLDNLNEKYIKLKDYFQTMRILTDQLQLEPEIFSALVVFHNNGLFSERFGDSSSFNFLMNINQFIQQQTRSALRQLESLICNESAKVGDLSNTFTKQLGELKGQTRRQRKIESELQPIFLYFRSREISSPRGGSKFSGTGALTLNMLRFEAAFFLIKLKERLPSFLSAIRGLRLDFILSAPMMESFQRINTDLDNLTLAETIQYQETLENQLQGLDFFDIDLISKLASETELSMGRILTFFKKSNFVELLEQALTRATGNPHVSGVLGKVGHLRELLRPFWDLRISLRAISTHFHRVRRMSPDNTACVSLDLLSNVIENWAECETYFRDRGMENIFQLIRKYQASGRFVSSLRSHAGGEFLSFYYTASRETNQKISLTPELLQEHVQWAVLGATDKQHCHTDGPQSETSKTLKDFIDSFDLAQKIHQLRLECEVAGHPDFQAQSGLEISPIGCQFQHIQDAMADVTAQLDNWKAQTNQAILDCPRLQLLTQQGLFHFLLLFRPSNLPPIIVVLSALPYVVQCFPSLIGDRKHLISLLTQFLPQVPLSNIASENLTSAVQLLRLIQDSQDTQGLGSHTTISEEHSEITRVELNSSDLNIRYRYHMQSTISTLGFPVVPAMVLWGDSHVSMNQIHSFVRVAQSGLVSLMQVVGVDRLPSRIRDELLRCFQQSLPRCPVQLIFGEQEGLDTFSQYKCEAFSEEVLTNIGPILDAAERGNSAVSVVCGGSGVGKSRWIMEDASRQGTPDRTRVLKFVVHEGFSVSSVIKQMETSLFVADFLERSADEPENQHSPRTPSSSPRTLHKADPEPINYDVLENPILVLIFDVTIFGDLSSFSRFLHHLLSLGLVYDEESGLSFALFPGTSLRVYLEFPTISVNDDTAVWPNYSEDWNPMHHPFSAQLPVFALLHSSVQYRKIDSRSFPLILDDNSRFIAAMVQISNQNKLDSDISFPTTPLPNVDDETILTTLTDFFSRNGFQPLNRSLTQAILLLSERFRYLARIKAGYLEEKKRRTRQDVIAFFQHFQGNFKDIFDLMVRECRDISSNNPNLPAVSIFSIRPKSSEKSNIPVESAFNFFVVTNDSNHPDFLAIQQRLKNMTLCVMDISSPVDMGQLRSAVAPIFGILNTTYMGQNLLDAGHLLTPESLVRLLHMHARRSILANVIYEGETGCGKSQNLKCYSYLINADSSCFANFKLHLLAFLLQAVRFIQAHPEADTEDGIRGKEIIENFNLATTKLLRMNSHLTKDELIHWTEEWLHYGNRNLPNEVGLFLCLFALNFLKNFPLYRGNLTPFVSHKLLKFRIWAAYQRIEILTKYLTLTHDAFTSDCLAAEKRCVPFPIEILLTPQALDTTITTTVSDRIFSDADDLMTFLHDFFSTQPSCLYHRILADDGLTPQRWRAFISRVKKSVEFNDPATVPPTVCVFVDELNTAGCLGMVSEVFSSRTLDGKPLPPWMFFVGAVNPHRKSSEAQADAAMVLTRSNIGTKLPKSNIETKPEDESKDYLAGVPYIVKRLPVNLAQSTIHYPNLSIKAEEEFLREYLFQHLKVPSSYPSSFDLSEFRKTCLRMILKAQSLVREFNIARVFMSIRNLIRATQLLTWLIKFQVRTTNTEPYLHTNIFLPDQSLIPPEERFSITLRHALIMSVTITYMFQLPSKGHVQIRMAAKDYREKFRNNIVQSWTKTLNIERCLNDIDEWSQVVSDSLEHFWKYAQIPPGLAKTRALMENLYSIVLAGENRIPLLITGPPGCGKTLAFNLACDNLKGPCPNHSVPFQELKKVTKLMYQCSVTSTGPELASRFSEAQDLQDEKERQQAGKHLVHVGVDEAGLTPENRQALKALHDHLDMRSIGTTMMSNTTLDAAKTSRMIQLLQTQANMEDLNALARGLLLPEKTSRQSKGYWTQVNGLCEAFYHIKDAVPKDCWFHSRDFVYLCRMLHRVIKNSTPVVTLFNSTMLLSCLRRHFQTLDSNQFPKLAKHFLTRCRLSFNDDQDPNASEDESSTVQLNLEPHMVKSLRASLKDLPDDPTDPTSAHCRYTMVVDPTDSETAVDLLFALELLDQDNTEVVSLSDFPEDSTPTRRTQTLAKVKKAIEEGKCLLLLNSGPLQSALYDVINRHYSINIFEDERGVAIKQPFANIALGSFSQMVEVHRNFRLVIHIPESQLSVTPMPFLNRMEKYQLSIRDAFEQRVFTVSRAPPPCLSSLETEQLRQSLFTTLRQGMEHFVNFSGGSSFYGMSINETIPALLLRFIEDTTHSHSSHLELRSSILLRAKQLIQSFESQYSRDDEGSIFMMNEHSDLETTFEFNPSNTSVSLHHQLRALLRSLNFQLLESARIESVFRLRSNFPQAYVRTYIDHQEHFSVVNLVSTLMTSRLASSKLHSPPTASEKLVVYTRSSDDLIRLMSPIHAAEYFNLQPRFENYNIQLMNENNFTFEDSDHPTLCILHLSQFQGSIACGNAIQVALRTSRDTCRMLLLIANMKSCTTNQVAFARHVVDQCLLKEHETLSQPQVIFLLHVPSQEIRFRSCYQTIPLNRWTSMYIDNFSDGSFLKVNLDQSINNNREEFNESQHPSPSLNHSRSSYFQWLRVAFALQDTLSVQDVRAEFGHLIDLALKKGVNSCSFQQQISPSFAHQPNMFFEKVGITNSLQAYQHGAKPWVIDLIRTRHYLLETILDSFADLWGRVLSATVSDACSRLEEGSTARGLIAFVRSSHNILLSDFMKLIVCQELAADWNLESLSRLPIDIDEGSFQQYSLQTEPSSWRWLMHFSPETTRIFLSISLLKFLISLHRTGNHEVGLGGGSNFVNHRIDCSNSKFAAKLPFFNSFLHYLDSLIPTSKEQFNKVQSIFQGPDSPPQLNLDSRTFRNLIDKSPLHVSLSQAIFFIEHCPLLWADFKHDMVCSRLGYSSHPPQEQLILIHIAERHLQQTSKSPNDVYKWVLAQQRIDDLLFPISRLLEQLRGFLSEDEFHQMYLLPPTSDPHAHLLSLAIQKLWEAFVSLTSQTLISVISWENWISCMREISSFEFFSASHTMLNFHQSQSDSSRFNQEENLSRFALMMSLFHTVAFLPANFVPSSLRFSCCEDGTKLCFSPGVGMSDDNFLLNHLQLLQRIHLVVDGFHLNQGLIDSLFWLISWLELNDLIRSMPTFKVLVAGLLGLSELPPDDQERLPLGLLRLFQNLHLESRLELLQLLYRRQPQALEESIDGLLTEMIREDQRDRMTTNVMYFPKEMMSLMTPFASTTLFPLLNLNGLPGDSPALEFIHPSGDLAALIAYQLLQLSQDNVSTLQHLCLEFKRLSQASDFRDPTPVLTQLQKTSCLAQIFQLSTVEMSESLKAGGQLNLLETLKSQIVIESLQEILSKAPRLLSLYLLSCFPDFSSVTLLLKDSAALQTLGIGFWFDTSPSTQEESVILDKKATFELFQIKLSAIHYSNLLTRYHSRVLRPKSPPIQTLLSSSVPEDKLTADCATLVNLLMSEDRPQQLSMNVHIPNIVALVSFLRSKLEYRFLNIEQARTTLIEDALTLLPATEENAGLKLFKTFLQSWAVLRANFQTFTICASELTQVAEIPPLTDKLGERPCYVSDLLEMSDASELESFPARILKILFKHTSEVLSNPSLESLRRDPAFNPLQCLVTNHMVKVELSRISSQLTQQSTTSALFTGPSSSEDLARFTKHVLLAHSHWVNDRPPLNVPPTLNNQVQMVNYKKVILPASMLQMDLPQLPDLPPLSGHFEVDWISIAKYLISTFVNGKIEIEFENYSFFSKLPFLTDISKCFEFEGVKAENQPFSNLFARVKVCADQLQGRLLEDQTILLEEEMLDSLRTLISSQQEQQQELFCNQCLDLMNEAFDFIDINPEASKTNLRDLMMNKPLSWEPSFTKALQSYSIRDLPVVSQFIANHACEGGKTYPNSFSVPLPMVLRSNLKTLQDEILNDIFTTSPRIDSFENDLQHFASFLTDSESLILKEKVSTPICELECVKNLLNLISSPSGSSSSSDSFQARNIQYFRQILQTGNFQIKNFAELMKMIRRLLGTVSYRKLSSLSTSSVQPELDEVPDEEQTCPKPLSFVDLDPSIYKELIPPEWEAPQQTKSEDVNSQKYEKSNRPPAPFSDRMESQFNLKTAWALIQGYLSKNPSSSLQPFLHNEDIDDETFLFVEDLWPTLLSHVDSSDYRKRISDCLGLSNSAEEEPLRVRLSPEDLVSAWGLLQSQIDSLSSFPEIVQILIHSGQSSEEHLLTIHSQWETLSQALRPFPCEKLKCLLQLKPFPLFHSKSILDLNSNPANAELMSRRLHVLSRATEMLKVWAPIHPLLNDLCLQIGLYSNSSQHISFSSLGSTTDDLDPLATPVLPVLLDLEPEDLLLITDQFVPLCNAFGEKIIPKRQLSLLFIQLLDNLLTCKQLNSSGLPEIIALEYSLRASLERLNSGFDELTGLGWMKRFPKPLEVFSKSWMQIRKYSIQNEHEYPLDPSHPPPYPPAFESLWTLGFFPNFEQEKDKIFQQILSSVTETTSDQNQGLNQQDFLRFEVLTEMEYVQYFQPRKKGSASAFRNNLGLVNKK